MRPSVALVLHGADADERQYLAEAGRRQPQIVDEPEAMRLAGAYCEGVHRTAARLASALFPGMAYAEPWLAFTRLHGEPSYAELRNFLEGDCNVAPLVAQRVALLYTWKVRWYGY